LQGTIRSPLLFADSLSVDGEGWFVIALAAREKRHGELQGFVMLHRPSPVRRLNQGR
jgi:hypothetical protein